MVKKARLVKEVRVTIKAIKFLALMVFAFGFLLVYSYSNVRVHENEKIFGQLFSQRGFDVAVTIRDATPPIILLEDNETFVCEKSSMDFPVMVLDFNKIIPEASLSVINPFYIIFFSKINEYTNEYRIVSPILTKENAGGVNQGWKTYLETIYMKDGDLIASKDLNITVIEINNVPFIENIGVKTVWTRGDNSVFKYQVNSTDIEDGDSNSFNLIFNISFEGEKLFDISPNGTMFFKPNSSQIGVYNISVCVKDKRIEKPHQNISICKQDGSSLTTCNNFSLTVTDENRAPVIINHTPFNLSLNINGEENIYFNITSHDADGTLVDNYWYVDGILKKYEPRKEVSNFSFSYICGFSGKSNITAVITDGELNNSIKWNITVTNAICPTASTGGGGGSGGGVACTERWVCGYWSECENLKENYLFNKVNYKVNTLISERCGLFNWSEEICGFQIRKCQDLKKCNSNLSMPGIMQECYFSLNPNCSDGIKNCHNDSCEIAVDCGGSCAACATCGDGIRNQDEAGIDCGGICNVCEIPKSKIDFFKILMYISLIFLILALIGITILGIRYILLKKKLGEISHVQN